jgi:leader peptidase (prepilin peptidase) / N-methyltransferase
VSGLDTFVVAAAVAFGLTFGSFATVAAHRIPRRESIVGGRSRCPSCGHTITAVENIPVVSYLVLRGRCRHCRASISPRYPIIELATGVLFALAAYKFLVAPGTYSAGDWLLASVYAAFFWTLVVLTVIDLDHKLLPNRIVYPTLVAGWLGLIAAALVGGDVDRLVDALIGAGVFGGFFFVVAFAYPRGMGMGDVKLALVLGTFLGYVGGLGLVVVGMFLSFLLGAVIGGILAARAGGDRKTQVPFGPFLAAGSVITVFAGRALLDAYRSITGI